jgi:hypothetical protein
MPRLTGPLFSLDARQTFGGVIVYSGWKGLSTCRLKVTPYNPKSTYQVGIRDTVKYGVMYFTKGAYVAAAQKTWWDTYAEGTNQSGWNRFLSKFVASNYDKDSGTFLYDSIPQPS